MKLSICIPFYKGQEYLKIAVESVIGQSNPNWLLIVVDNCGPENNTQELIDSFNDQRISYFRNSENIGLPRNWNKCLDLAVSPLVTLLHADDELAPEYVELMLGTVRKFPEAAAYFCRAEVIDSFGKRTFSFPDFIKTLIMPSRSKTLILKGENSATSLMKGNFIFCPTLCYRKDIITSQRFSTHWEMVLDFEFILNLITQDRLIVGLPEKAYRYRRHFNNTTVHLTASMSRFKEEIKLFKAFSVIFSNKGWPVASLTASKIRIIKFHMLYLIALDTIKFRRKAVVQKISFAKEHKIFP